MILERYILKNFVGPFFFSISVITFVFIMDFILKYIDLFLGKGVPFHIVLQTFILSLGHMFALIIPMAVLPATLMAFGNLASENEITAMKATGFGLYRLVLPGTVAAVFLSIGLVFYNNYVLPESNHKLLNLLLDINRKQPTVELQENKFIDALEGYTIYFREKNDRTGELSEVQIYRHNKKGQLPTTIIAASGKLEVIEEENALRVDLFNGEIHELPVARDRSTYRRTRFEEYTIYIENLDRSMKRSTRNFRGDREMSVGMMQAKINEIYARMEVARIKMGDIAERRVNETMRLLDTDYRQSLFAPKDTSTADVDTNADASAAAASIYASNRSGRASLRSRGANNATSPPLQGRNEYITRQEIETQVKKNEGDVRQINRYRVEIQKKYSIPFSCLIFVLVGSPLAIRLGKSGMGMAIGFSILFFLVYYVCLIGGEKMADRGLMNPVWSMWSPNIIFGVVSIFLLRSAAREQGVSEWTLLRVVKTIFRRNALQNPR